MDSTVSNAKWFDNEYKCSGRGDMMKKYAVKIEQDGGDDTGLTNLWMECLSGKTQRGGFKDWGTWRNTEECPNYMVGFRMQMCNSNVGAANVVMYCSRPGNDYKMSGTWYEDNDGSCKWGPVQFCREKYGICGFKYEYEPAQRGHRDDSGLTNLKMLCCPIPGIMSFTCIRYTCLVTQKKYDQADENQ